MKIYFSKYYDDYIFVIGGQPYYFCNCTIHGQQSMVLIEVHPNHLKNSRMHKLEQDKEVIYICTVKD